MGLDGEIAQESLCRMEPADFVNSRLIAQETRALFVHST